MLRYTFMFMLMQNFFTSTSLNNKLHDNVFWGYVNFMNTLLCILRVIAYQLSGSPSPVSVNSPNVLNTEHAFNILPNRLCWLHCMPNIFFNHKFDFKHTFFYRWNMHWPNGAKSLLCSDKNPKPNRVKQKNN